MQIVAASPEDAWAHRLSSPPRITPSHFIEVLEETERSSDRRVSRYKYVLCRFEPDSRGECT